jgi:uncharacterized membrane protein YbhN (UPF0104 family)
MKEAIKRDESLIKKAFPWFMASGILCFLFWRIDFNLFLDAIKFARMEIYLPAAIIFIFVWFMIESLNLSALFTIFGHGVSFKDMRKIRGASYLLMIINYNLGLGGIAWYLKRRHQIPFLRASGVMFYYFFVESVGITFAAAVGCFFLRNTSPVFWKISVIAFLMCTSYLGCFFLYRLAPAKGFFKKIKSNPLFLALNEGTINSFFILIFWRALYFSSFILFFYISLKAFNMNIPLLTLFSLVPVIFFIGNIPITPFGIGTIQAAMAFFFSQYGTEANILAFSVTYTSTLLFLRLPIGLVYLRRV